MNKSNSSKYQPTKTTNLKAKLTLPDTITAGDKLNLLIPIGLEGCNLLVNSSWGTWWFDSLGTQLLFPDSLTKQAGQIDLSLICGAKNIFQKNIFVKPTGSHKTLETFLGAKSIIADGEHWAMITAIPTDSLTNPMPDGTQVDFKLTRPNTSQESYEEKSNGLVAYRKIYSQSLVGKTIVGVKSGTSFSKEKELLEIEGYPTNFSISSEEVYQYADARQYFKLRTDIIKDKFGNKVADGTIVHILIEDPDGSFRQLSTNTFNGVARLRIQNPMIAGNLKISASIFGGVLSNTLTISFLKSIEDFPIKFNRQKKQLRIGPVVGNLGQFMPDGSEVEVTILKNNKIIKKAIIDGYTVFDFSQEAQPLGKITIRVGGLEKIGELR